jgi:hypothetical protein
MFLSPIRFVSLNRQCFLYKYTINNSFINSTKSAFISLSHKIHFLIAALLGSLFEFGH